MALFRALNPPAIFLLTIRNPIDTTVLSRTSSRSSEAISIHRTFLGFVQKWATPFSSTVANTHERGNWLSTVFR